MGRAGHREGHMNNPNVVLILCITRWGIAVARHVGRIFGDQRCLFRLSTRVHDCRYEILDFRLRDLQA